MAYLLAHLQRPGIFARTPFLAQAFRVIAFRAAVLIFATPVFLPERLPLRLLVRAQNERALRPLMRTSFLPGGHDFEDFRFFAMVLLLVVLQLDF